MASPKERALDDGGPIFPVLAPRNHIQAVKARIDIVELFPIARLLMRKG